jgi:hypothetical protein
MSTEIRIDKKMQCLLPKLSDEERATLEKLILRDGKCHDPLKVWAGKGILLDGHNRYEICKKHGIPYAIEFVEFSSRAEAIKWVVEYHLGRRNFTPEQLSYFRGMRYNEEKTAGHGAKMNGAAGKHCPQTTADRIAKEEKVATRTIKNDAQFAQAIDDIADKLGEDLRDKILSRETRVKKKHTIRLKLELFARRRREGWQAWGDELPPEP